jgi:hypothetical protein
MGTVLLIKFSLYSERIMVLTNHGRGDLWHLYSQVEVVGVDVGPVGDLADVANVRIVSSTVLFCEAYILCKDRTSVVDDLVRVFVLGGRDGRGVCCRGRVLVR